MVALSDPARLETNFVAVVGLPVTYDACSDCSTLHIRTIYVANSPKEAAMAFGCVGGSTGAPAD